LVWFENSAHTPHLEEPKKFRALFEQVRAGEPVHAGHDSGLRRAPTAPITANDH
jgi:hypothetical protein